LATGSIVRSRMSSAKGRIIMWNPGGEIWVPSSSSCSCCLSDYFVIGVNSLLGATRQQIEGKRSHAAWLCKLRFYLGLPFDPDSSEKHIYQASNQQRCKNESTPFDLLSTSHKVTNRYLRLHLDK
jgi:hypothetical protein